MSLAYETRPNYRQIEHLPEPAKSIALSRIGRVSRELRERLRPPAVPPPETARACDHDASSLELDPRDPLGAMRCKECP